MNRPSKSTTLVIFLSALLLLGLGACSDETPISPTAPSGVDIGGVDTPGGADKTPNGTRPMQLVALSVTSVNSTQMRVSGRYLNMVGAGYSGMKVNIYSVGEAYFTRWSTIYTTSGGNFSAVVNKVPVGSKVQIEVEGNGAYSRPLPTFNRP